MDNNKVSILKSTRESKGLTLEIVHEATKIPMDALRAIEEGYSTRALSPFYYRGFIKIYSEFLGLNVGDMYKQYGLDQTPKPMVPSAQGSSKELAAKEPNVLLERILAALSSVFKPKTFKTLLKVAGVLLAFFLIYKLAGDVASHLGKKAVSPKKHAVVYRPKSAAALAPQEIKHESVTAQSQNDKVEVAVRATRDTWMQVKADDKVVFQMTLNKGAMEDWTAENRLQISGRNLEQLDMEVNGRHIGSLGNGERRIRRIVITKEGLTVKK